MKALVYRGNGQFSLEQRTTPDPGPNEAVVKVKAAGLCGSDLHIKSLHDERMLRDSAYRPVIAGHEPAGIVVSVGTGVKAVAPGDRVAVYHKIGCGSCRHCREGNVVFCSRGGALSGEYDGAFQDCISVPANCCLPLPEAVSFSDGAVMMCAGGTAYSGLKKVSPRAGEWLAVFGCGPVGLCTLILAKKMNLKTVCVDVSDYRLDLALRCGSDQVINSGTDPDEYGVYDLIHGFPVTASSTVKEIYRLTAGRGTDIAAECSAAPSARINAVDALKKGGRAVFLGIDSGFHSAGVFQRSLEMDKVIFKELELYGSNVFPMGMYDEMIDFVLTNNVTFEGIITHRFPLDLGAQAFTTAESGQSGKIMLQWEE